MYMLANLRMRRRRAALRGSLPSDGFILTLSFMIGSAAVFLLLRMGLLSGSERMLPFLVEGGFCAVLLRCCAFPALLLFLSGSIWGAALVPLLMAVFSGLVTLVACYVAQHGALTVILTFGLPAGLVVPSCFVLAMDCASSSRSLSAAWRGRAAPTPPVPLVRHCLLIFPVLLFAALLDTYFIPALLLRLPV